MIRRLSKDVRGQLRTGVALTGVAQAVEELVLNAVDAGATCVAVRIDLPNLTLQVIDNGSGIPADQLPLVGERYSTSKCHTVDDLENLKYFGYRGEALASLCSAASFLEIITRPKSSTVTYTKCFHKGRPLPPQEARTPRPSAGTTVNVRDLFYNLPVRKKSLNEGLEVEKIRYRMAGLALMWPSVSFSLRDDVTGNVILQTHKCSSILATFSSLFGGLRAKSMCEVAAQDGVFQMSGFVSRENYSRKDLQFVFVNKRLVLKSKIHKVLNSALGKSTLIKRRVVNVSDKNLSQSNNSEQDKVPVVDASSPTKQFERYGVFVINIDCPFSAYDITFDPAKTLVEFHDWPGVTSLIESMILKFLREENLLLPSEQQQSDATTAAEGCQHVHVSKTPDLLPESVDPFEGDTEEVDEDLLMQQQQKRYAQGISTHNSLNSLFSRTVRRPRLAPLDEGDLPSDPSCAKKSKLNSDTYSSDAGRPSITGKTSQHDVGKAQKLQACHKITSLEDSPITDEAQENPAPTVLRKGRRSVENLHTPITDEAQENPAPTVLRKGRRSVENLHTPITDEAQENPAPTVLRKGRRSLENSDTSKNRVRVPERHVSDVEEIHRASKHGLSEIALPVTFQKQTLAQRLGVEAPASDVSDTDEIRLPEQFAYKSSLRRLRSEFQSSTDSKLSAVSSSAALQKFHRTGAKKSIFGRHDIVDTSEEIQGERRPQEHVSADRSGEIVLPSSRRHDRPNGREEIHDRRRPQESVSASADDNGEIILPPLRRPSLYRSRSLDAQQKTFDPKDEQLLKTKSHSHKKYSASLPRQSRSDAADDFNVTYNCSVVDTELTAGRFHPGRSKPLSLVTRSSLDAEFSDFMPEYTGRGKASLRGNVRVKSTKHQPACDADNDAVIPLPSRKREHPCSVTDDASAVGSTQLSGPQKAGHRQGLSQAAKLARLVRRGQEAGPEDTVVAEERHPALGVTNISDQHTRRVQQTMKAVHRCEIPVAVSQQSRFLTQNSDPITSHNSTRLGREECSVELTALEMLASNSCHQGSRRRQPGVEAVSVDSFHQPSFFQTSHAALADVPSAHTGHHANMATGATQTDCGSILQRSFPAPTVLSETPSTVFSCLKQPDREQHNFRVFDNESHFPIGSDSRPRRLAEAASLYRGGDFHFGEICGDGPAVGVANGLAKYSSVSVSGDFLTTHTLGKTSDSSLIQVSAFPSSSEDSVIQHSRCNAHRKDTSSSGSQTEQSILTQSTQGFRTSSTQGFAPRLSDQDSMPFDVIPAVNKTHTDSPLSTGSAGFTPTVCDPMLSESDEENCKPASLEGGRVMRSHVTAVSGSNDSHLATKAASEVRRTTKQHTFQRHLLDMNRESLEESVSPEMPTAPKGERKKTGHSQASQTSTNTVSLDVHRIPRHSDYLADSQTQPATMTDSSDITCGQRTPEHGDSGSHQSETQSQDSLLFLLHGRPVPALTVPVLNPGSKQGESQNKEDLKSSSSEGPGEVAENGSGGYDSRGSEARGDVHVSRQVLEELVQPGAASKDNSMGHDSRSLGTQNEGHVSLEVPGTSVLKVKSPTPAQAEKKRLMERTYDLSGLRRSPVKPAEKRETAVTNPAVFGSTRSMAPSNSHSTRSSEESPVRTVKETPTASQTCDPVNIEISTSQQSDGFSDSLPDSALVGMVMPGTQTSQLSSDASKPSDGARPSSTPSSVFTQNAYNLGSVACSIPSTHVPSSAVFGSISVPELPGDGEKEHTHFSLQSEVNKSDDRTGVTSRSDTAASISQKLSQRKADGNVREVLSDTGAKAALNQKQESQQHQHDDIEQENITKDRSVRWVPMTDPKTGGRVYMNSSSGHTLTQAQWEEMELDEEDTNVGSSGSKSEQPAGVQKKSRQDDVHELSPLSHQNLEALLAEHFEEDDEESRTKWRDGCKTDATENSSQNLTEDLLNSWDNPVFTKPGQIMQVTEQKQSSRAGKLAQCFLHPTTFTKEMLAGGKVIGQLDNKFVACLIQEEKTPSSSDNQTVCSDGGLVVLFDQHAAHERVRLEQLISSVYEKNGIEDSEARFIRRTDVSPPRTVTLSEEEVRLMLSFREEFDRIGIVFDMDAKRRDTIHVRTMPACMAQREANDRKRGKDPLSYEYVETMIREHTQLLKTTAGARRQLPRSVHRLLSTHACKGAVKFGDRLSVATCQELIQSLSSCDLPFQCAHGRPSIAPLLSLSQLKLVSQETKRPVSLWKLRKQVQKD